MSNYDNSKQIEIALWEKTSQKGNTYYFGKSETHKVTLFPNNSANPKAPAYRIFLEPLDSAERPAENLPF